MYLSCDKYLRGDTTLLQKPFERKGFPARVHPISFLGLAWFSQIGMSFVQQGLVILGTFFLTMYHLNLAQLGFVTTALSLGVVVSMVFVGATVDRFGPRVVLFWGTVLMTGLSLLLLTAHSFASLLVILFFVGVSLAVTPATGTKAVFTAFANRPRGLVMGIRQTGVPLGAAVSAWLLPTLASGWGLHRIYLLFAAELLVAGWAFSIVMQPWKTRGGSARGNTRFGKRDFRSVLKPLSVAFLLVSGQYILLTYSIADLHRVHHLAIGLAGIIVALSQVGGGLGRIVLGQVSDWMGGQRPRVVAMAASLGAAAAFVTGWLPSTTPVWVLFIVWVLFGFGAVGWNALVLTWSAESVPSDKSGFAMGLTGSTVFFGSSIYPPLFGTIVDTTHHMAFGWWMLSGILLIAAVIAFTTSRRVSATAPAP